MNGLSGCVASCQLWRARRPHVRMVAREMGKPPPAEPYSQRPLFFAREDVPALDAVEVHAARITLHRQVAVTPWAGPEQQHRSPSFPPSPAVAWPSHAASAASVRQLPLQRPLTSWAARHTLQSRFSATRHTAITAPPSSALPGRAATGDARSRTHQQACRATARHARAPRPIARHRPSRDAPWPRRWAHVSLVACPPAAYSVLDV